MTEAMDRLTTALADRYKIERHLGEGGMAAVYLAEDLKHKRRVAVKVLRPELAAVLGAERFVQEITTTANRLGEGSHARGAYSCLNASTRSTRVARRAGTTQARNPAEDSVSTIAR